MGMILAIDIENSDLVIGGLQNGEIKFTARLGTDHSKTKDEYAVELLSVLSLYGKHKESIEGCIISSVVPPVLQEVRTAVQQLTGLKPYIVGPGMKTGLNIKIENPQSMGSDMIAISVAALQEYGFPLIIFDMNTVTSVSVVDAAGCYCGGCLYPGIRTGLDAMWDHTAQLPRIGLEIPQNVIGRNTVECMRSGVLFGAAAAVDGLSERIEQELGKKAQVILTGRQAYFVKDICRHDMIFDENLLIKGLCILYEKNRK